MAVKFGLKNLLVQLGYKKSQNPPSQTTSTGQYSHLMFNNISDPSVSNEEACAWVVQHKREVTQGMFGK